MITKLKTEKERAKIIKALTTSIAHWSNVVAKEHVHAQKCYDKFDWQGEVVDPGEWRAGCLLCEEFQDVALEGNENGCNDCPMNGWWTMHGKVQRGEEPSNCVMEGCSYGEFSLPSKQDAEQVANKAAIVLADMLRAREHYFHIEVEQEKKYWFYTLKPIEELLELSDMRPVFSDTELIGINDDFLNKAITKRMLRRPYVIRTERPPYAIKAGYVEILGEEFYMRWMVRCEDPAEELVLWDEVTK